MLMSGDAGKITSEQKSFLDEIYKGNKRMVELVNSLLNVSRIEMGTFAVEPKPIDIFEVAQSVIDELVPMIKEKKLKIEKTFDEKIKTMNLDPNLIRMVFQNLLSNAVKYNNQGGFVKLAIAKKKKEVIVSVKDAGYGIPKNVQAKIFTKMFRADNVKAKDTTGTGLGLYMVKSIIEQSGGKVWFESEEDKGSTFYFTLPESGMKKKEGTRALT
jgi:signal transduction histidine kinase